MRSLTLTGAAILAAALLTGCAGMTSSPSTSPGAAGRLQPKVAGLNGQIAFIQEEDISIQEEDVSIANQLSAIPAHPWRGRRSDWPAPSGLGICAQYCRRAISRTDRLGDPGGRGHSPHALWPASSAAFTPADG